METFSCHLPYKRVQLFTAADVAQHSFIVMKSISPLNLELCQSHKVGDCPMSRNYYPSFSYSKDFIDIKEKCRKIHGNRDILYNLHLDIPKTKESGLLFRSLESCFYTDYFLERSRSSIPVVEIYIKHNFFIDKLFRFVEYASQNNYNMLKFLTWLIKFDAVTASQLRHMPATIVNYIAECMHPGFNDMEFVTKCLLKVDFNSFNNFNENPERFANVLYQVQRTGRKPKIMLWCDELITQYLLDEAFQNICEVFKFLDAPKFGDDFKQTLLLAVSFEFMECMRYYTYRYSSATSDRRHLLQVYLLWFYSKSKRNPLAAADAVRLVWRTIPDPFLTHQEMATAYSDIELNSEVIKDIYNFYCQAVEKDGSSKQPRSLQHYCRTTIRRTLWENNRWLPEGIEETGLPQILQSYLNLQ